ncbi:uncharacterized protein LOC119383841 [Rhipicephalus sanguineus]|uniref:uncharacterized protein LOC119383841 n=1 Tax=Rhipicephalus sanguineus TaxID=34632 RepID=UPI0020C30FCE|nr:uncharacterized protein LOC119383841 [Rhipicephalus sanguineus]
MQIYGGLILWTIVATAAAFNSMFHRLGVDVSPYQNPWKVANSSSNAYLSHASSTLERNSQTLCVRSRYFGPGENGTVERSLDFYPRNYSFPPPPAVASTPPNNNNRHHSGSKIDEYVSINISLSERNQSGSTILVADVKHEIAL